ncbi:MAG: hypothetical protein AAFO94_09620 [Bacteroidota bacterium]
MEPNTLLQQLTEFRLLAFYGWWQFGVFLFAFAALMIIWYHIGRRQQDFGQVWLALSVLCWSFSGLIEVYFAQQWQSEQQEVLSAFAKSNNAFTYTDLEAAFAKFDTAQQRQQYLLEGWQSILSLFNSLFILLALPWFRYMPGRLEAIIKSKYWGIIIGLPFLFSLLPTVSKMIMGRSLGLISEPDVYYAVLTLSFLGFVLWASFANRRLQLLAWLSVVCILITFIAQVLKIFGPELNQTLFSAIFKASLIMIFFALALSWVRELSENIIPPARQLYLRFAQSKNEKGKLQNIVLVNGLPGGQERRVSFTPALYELFLEFARRRKSNVKEGWLEIKPKNDDRSSITYDIHDHNQIKRILHTLLDGLFGKGAWSKVQHEQPLRQALFESSAQRDRLIRLKVPGENIMV